MKFAQLFLTAGLVLGAAASHAAPTQSRTMLPIGKKLVEALKNDHGYSDAEATNFIKEINKFSFYADHKNPKNIDQDDYDKPKTFYMAPFFQPSPERSVVGSTMIAEYALRVGESIDELVDVFSFRLTELKENAAGIRNYTGRAVKLQKKIEDKLEENPQPKEQIEDLKKTLATYYAKIKDFKARNTEILRKGSKDYEAMDPELRQEVVGNIIYNFAKLGVSPTAKQDKALKSANAQVALAAMAELRLASSEGQYGVRSVVVESGLSEGQLQTLALYRSLRTDVTINQLPTNKVYVEATIQTVGRKGKIRKGFLLVRDVNRGSENPEGRGECGSLQTCNITIEYTEVGAREAITSQANAINLPVTFSGDTKVSVPDFVGRFDCKFKNGWHAKGRSDVKDGAVIYDGDVYNRINFTDYAIEEYCKVEVSEGDKDSAQYALLMEIVDFYKTLNFKRTIRNEREKKAYMRKVMAEIDAHAKKSQQKNGSYMGYVVAWARGTLGGWQAAVAGIFSAARNFYWHTRIEDTKVESTVEVHKSFSYKNMVQTMEFGFDGYPIICHKEGRLAGEKVMVACKGEIKKKVNNEADNYDQNCSWMNSKDCQEFIDSVVIANEDGYLEM